jgi:hypothetical protein
MRFLTNFNTSKRGEQEPLRGKIVLTLNNNNNMVGRSAGEHQLHARHNRKLVEAGEALKKKLRTDGRTDGTALYEEAAALVTTTTSPFPFHACSFGPK